MNRSSSLKNQAKLSAFCISLTAVFLLTTAVYSAPSQEAPGGNTPRPINTGTEAQTKSGNLIVDNTFTANTVTATTSASTPLFCLNGSCRSSWPSASYSTPSLSQVVQNGNNTSRPLWVSTGAQVCLGGVCRHYWPSASLGGWGGTYYVDPVNNNGQYSYCPSGYLACGIRSNLYRYHTPETLICCRVSFSTN